MADLILKLLKSCAMLDNDYLISPAQPYNDDDVRPSQQQSRYLLEALAVLLTYSDGPTLAKKQANLVAQ